MQPRRNFHWEFSLSALLGIAVGLLAAASQPDFGFVAGAAVFFVVFLACELRQLSRLTPAYLGRNARKADEPVFVIFAVTLVVAASALASLFLLIHQKGAPDPLELCTALLAVALGWLTIQVLFAVHYAHLCWLDEEATRRTGVEVSRVRAEGLDFPGNEQPGGWDFLYFSATVGMTAQTADTDITSSRVRRLVLVHGLISYFFNAVILAAVVNVAISLGG